MKKLLSLLLGLCLLLCSAALAEELPQEDYYGRYMAARTEEERQAVLAEMPDTRYPAYDANTMKWGFIDRVGRWVSEPQWDDMIAFDHGRYAMVIQSLDDGGFRNMIVDENGRIIADLPEEFDEFRGNLTSDYLALTSWSENTEWYFDANTGKLLNKVGYLHGNADEGYVVDRNYNDYPQLGYLLNSQGERVGEGLWFEAMTCRFTPADNPEAPWMYLGYWNREWWEETVENDPSVLELCGDDLSWVETRPEGYSLIAVDGTIACTAENADEFLWHERDNPDAYATDSLSAASSAGLAWKDNYPEDPDTIYLMDQAGNCYYSMYLEEWELHHGAYEDLQPTDDIFLVWNESGEYGYLNGDGSMLYPPQFRYAERFVDGMAAVCWEYEEPLPCWNWTEEQY